MSQLTTHVLDTSLGKPASGVSIILYALHGERWDMIAEGVTDADGRVSGLLNKEYKLSGVYKMKFETNVYFFATNRQSFYPYVEITFEVDSNDHYHIPLLLNPFGYTTYRGS